MDNNEKRAELIDKIRSYSTSIFGESIIECLDYYNVYGIQDLTTEQLQEYVNKMEK